MMRIIIITILISSIINFSSAQINLEKSIWVSTMVHDTLGNAYPNQNVERFMYFENNNNISTLSIDQKTSMSNGETIISYMVEANNLAQISDNTFKVKEYRVDNFSVVSEDSIYYREKNYHVGFKKLKIDQSNQTQKEYLDFLLNNKVRQYYENGTNLNQIHRYKQDGSKDIEVIDSKSKWESPFRIISFEGFVFLRGITSNPIILTNLQQNKIEGFEINRTKKPIRTEIKIE